MESSRPDTWLYMIALIVAFMVLAICLILLLCALLMIMVPLILGILISILSIIFIAFMQLVFKGADIVRRDASVVINFTTDRYLANVSSRPFSNGSYARVDSCHQVETKESKDQVETFVSVSELVIAKCTAPVPNGIASTMNIRPNSDSIHPSGDIIAFNHEHGGQNESGQRDSDVSKESLETGSPNELSTENDEFFYQSAKIETNTDTYEPIAFVCGQLSSTLATAATLDGELVCGLCEKDKNKLVNNQSQKEPPCETPSEVQEQIDSDDYPDMEEMVCVNNTVVTAKTQDLPSILVNEAVVADVPADTSDISDSELSDGDDTDDHACAGGDPASELKAEMLSRLWGEDAVGLGLARSPALLTSAASTNEQPLSTNTTIIPLTELGFLYRDSTSASTTANSMIICNRPMLPHFPGELECGVKWRDKKSEPPSDTSSASGSPMMKYL